MAGSVTKIFQGPKASNNARREISVNKNVTPIARENSYRVVKTVCSLIERKNDDIKKVVIVKDEQRRHFITNRVQYENIARS